MLLLLVAVVLAGCSSNASGSTKSDLNDQANTVGKYQGFPADPPLPRPSFTLTDTSGAPYSFSTETAGHPTLLYFGYTECPDVCPTTMADIGNALRAVPSSLRDKTEVVFVTTDVKHDTPAVIASWLRHFDAGLPNQFVGLSGTQTQVDTAQAAAHVMLAEDGGQQHSAKVLLYGADDYSHVSFEQSTNLSDQIAHDLKV
ncbi:SCO family protein [Jatrophihabitans sp. GAS493]|uniref:SCO family protein n=1 Tax=Jatrophihabitans sp. GAS493 TaxID=1907575 RepID=UPI00352A4840